MWHESLKGGTKINAFNHLFGADVDSDAILRKHKNIRRTLLQSGQAFIEKRVAILGGSTTAGIRNALELFLLANGIKPEFYESEYAQYWEDAMFGAELKAFRPDVIFIHTTSRNITRFPEIGESEASVGDLLASQFEKFRAMWGKLAENFQCPVIQNNFEMPYVRVLGNSDASFVFGKINFLTRLNLMLYEYAQTHTGFYVNDINYLSADYGLKEWLDPFYWHMYKYALCAPAIPYLAQSAANIIKSIYGRNKKAFALDLDNTLWGGVIGDDGPENIEIGQETPMGQVFAEFQNYIKEHKKLGAILNVVSKNDEHNALAGLNRPDSALKPGDFVMVKANWEPKSQNLLDMAGALALLPESFVFVDDNPAEREIVRQQAPGCAVPDLSRPEYYAKEIDANGWFETTSLSADDFRRAEMYKVNASREASRGNFADYNDYLLSLEMRAEIKPFAPMYMSRIAQLSNKSNQYNLTTLRLTLEETEALARDENSVTLYGKLTDKFGDNGVVSVAAGKVDGADLKIVLWLMSCRVLKRDMEYAMMDEMAKAAKARGITRLIGYYRPTSKNGMVKDFYEKQGFEKIFEGGDGSAEYSLDISGANPSRQNAIKVNVAEGQ